VWRRTLIDERRAGIALADLADLPLRRAPHLPLLPRCWELRHNLTPYDAAYVALAEALEVALVTADRRLSRAAGIRCAVDVVELTLRFPGIGADKRAAGRGSERLPLLAS